MHDWLAMGLIPTGLGILAAGIVKRRAKIRAPLPAGAIRPEFAAMGEMVRPIMMVAVGFIALKMTLFYFVLGGRAYLTPLDFAGLLFVLGSYAGYVVLATAKPVVAAETIGAGMRPAR